MRPTTISLDIILILIIFIARITSQDIKFRIYIKLKLNIRQKVLKIKILNGFQQLILLQSQINNNNSSYILLKNHVLNIQIQMIFGQYSPTIYFQVSSVVACATLIIIYWISQYYGHDKPFPATSISRVANHFPEYVFFRTATISGSVLLILGWMTNHFYIRTVALQKVINIHKYRPGIMLFFGVTGGIALMGSTANIDTGHQDMNWHQKCAATFFVTTIIAQLYNTILYTKLSYSFNAVSRNLVYCKLIHTALLLVQIFFDSTSSFFENYSNQLEEGANDQNSKSNYYQWTISFTILAGFFFMSLDVANFRFVYEENKKAENSSQYETSNQSEQVYTGS